LPIILAAATGARSWFLTASLPHAVGIDEPPPLQIVSLRQERR